MGDEWEACRAAEEEMVVVFGENQTKLVEISEIESDWWGHRHDEVLVGAALVLDRLVVQLKLKEIRLDLKGLRSFEAITVDLSSLILTFVASKITNEWKSIVLFKWSSQFKLRSLVDVKL